MSELKDTFTATTSDVIPQTEFNEFVSAAKCIPGCM